MEYSYYYIRTYDIVLRLSTVLYVCDWGGEIVKNVIPICSYIYMVNLMPKHDYVSIRKHETCWFLLPSKNCNM